MGYLVAFAVQFVICFYFFLLAACYSAMALGIFMLMTLLFNDLKLNLNSINKCAESKSERSQLRSCIIDTIHFHSVVKQLGGSPDVHYNVSRFMALVLTFRHVRDISNLLQPSAMVLLTFSTMMISGGMLMIRLQIVERF